MRNKLLRIFDGDWEKGTQEINKSLSVSGSFVVKVDSIIFNWDF